MDSVAPLGKAYQDMVRKGLYEERWVDVFPNRGKRSGAYSGGAHETRPFILLNYEDTIAGVATLAHEVGHSAHSALARAAQPAATSGYSLFIAGTPVGNRGNRLEWPLSCSECSFFCVGGWVGDAFAGSSQAVCPLAWRAGTDAAATRLSLGLPPPLASRGLPCCLCRPRSLPASRRPAAP